MRVKTYFNVFIITEDDDNLSITYYNQVDIKMNLSQTVMEKMVPIQLAEWYKRVIAALNNKLAIQNQNENNHKIEEKPLHSTR